MTDVIRSALAYLALLDEIGQATGHCRRGFKYNAIHRKIQ